MSFENRSRNTKEEAQEPEFGSEWPIKCTLFEDKPFLKDEQYLCFMEMDCYKSERQGVKDWQEELFAPEKFAGKSLEEEERRRSNFPDLFMEEFLTAVIVHDKNIPNDGFARIDQMFLIENGQFLRVIDQWLKESEQNPTLTNMEVDIIIPQKPWQIKVEES